MAFLVRPQTGDLWIGDVGQNRWEEVDHLRPGARGGTNFGWSYYEGTHVFKVQPINRAHLKFPASSTHTRSRPGPGTAPSSAATSTAARS